MSGEKRGLGTKGMVAGMKQMLKWHLLLRGDPTILLRLGFFARR
jgi:hypothetical protein